MLYKIKEIFLLNSWNILFIVIVILIIIVFSCFSNNSLWEGKIFLLNGWKVKYLFSIIKPALEYFVSIKILPLASTQTFFVNNTTFVSGKDRKNSYHTLAIKEKTKQLGNPIYSMLDSTFKIIYPTVLFLLQNLNLNSQIFECLHKFMIFFTHFYYVHALI